MDRIGVVAGEASGDLHAANLVRALRALRPEAAAWAVGGAALRDAGAEVIFPTEALGGMGLTEAAGKLPALVRAWRRVVGRLDRDPPDLLVPVDFGAFNLRLAAAARRRGVPVVYYIPPKVWAWGAWRVKRLRRDVDEALVILPFEEAYLRERGVAARYVGSPVADHLGPRRFAPERDAVGLLPGSRTGEVSRIWPLLLGAARRLGEGAALRFLVPRAPGLSPDALPVPADFDRPVEFVEGDAQQVMERSRMCLVASGTATLECALVGTPLVAVYRVSPLTYLLGRWLVRAPFIALPNLIAGRRVVPELIQTDPAAVARAAAPLLAEGPERAAMIASLREVREAVGPPGASAEAARRLLAHLDRFRRAPEEPPCT